MGISIQSTSFKFNNCIEMENEKSKDRFVDKNYTLLDFKSHVLVVCPKCDGKASIINELGTPNIKFTCNGCGYFKKKEWEIFDLIIKRNCDQCGKKIERRIKNVKGKKKTIKSKCPHCQQMREVEPKYFYAADLFYHDPDWSKDPYFGFKYWLNANIKGEIFWALNEDHLAYLKSYIQAKVRERNNLGFMTMVEKLPNFIKAAKNRIELLKAIEKLERKK